MSRKLIIKLIWSKLLPILYDMIYMIVTLKDRRREETKVNLSLTSQVTSVSFRVSPKRTDTSLL